MGRVLAFPLLHLSGFVVEDRRPSHPESDTDGLQRTKYLAAQSEALVSFSEMPHATESQSVMLVMNCPLFPNMLVTLSIDVVIGLAVLGRPVDVSELQDSRDEDRVQNTCLAESRFCDFDLVD